MTKLSRRLLGLRWPLTDQALSSFANFLLLVVLAHHASPAALGTFALGFSGYLLTLGCTRSLLCMPLLISERSREREGEVLLGSMLFGVLLSAAALPVLLAASGTGLNLSLVLLCGLPGLLLQDGVRFVLLGRDQPQQAALHDALFSLGAAGAFAALAGFRQDSPTPYLVTWVVAGSLVGAVGWLRIGVGSSLKRLRQYLKAERRLGLNLLIENGALALHGQLEALLIAYFGALEIVAATRVAQANILGPINVVVQGMQSHLLVKVRHYAGERRELLVHVLYVVALLLVLPVGAAAALLLLPAGVGTALAGRSFYLARPLLVPVAVATGLHGGIVVASACLRFSLPARRMRNLRLFITLQSLVGVAAGLIVAERTGLGIAMVLTSVVAALVVLAHLAASDRTAAPGPVDNSERKAAHISRGPP